MNEKHDPHGRYCYVCIVFLLCFTFLCFAPAVICLSYSCWGFFLSTSFERVGLDLDHKVVIGGGRNTTRINLAMFYFR